MDAEASDARLTPPLQRSIVSGEIAASGVTVALCSDGTLSATYLSTPGNTTDLVFDVTGYFVP